MSSLVHIFELAMSLKISLSACHHLLLLTASSATLVVVGQGFR
jgi:hypothetical protein